MKPEKMTDEEMVEAQRARHAGDSSEADWGDEWGDKVFAHIAALTAERETLNDTFQRTLGELDECHRENLALRERVQALEKARDEVAEMRAKQAKRANAAERHLAVIRQRAGDADGLEAAWVSGDGHISGLRAVARYVLGEDATGAEPTCVMCAGANEHQACAIHPEPTTAEAFATACRSAEVWKGCIDAVELGAAAQAAHGRLIDALSWLARRMGAMDAAARTALRVAELGSSMTSGQISALRFALTDAPPVFTLEEVDEVLRTVAHQGSAARMDEPLMQSMRTSAMERLTALRKVTP
jgi:hypothetical protein